MLKFGVLAACAAFLLTVQAAEARPRHHHRAVRTVQATITCDTRGCSDHAVAAPRSEIVTVESEGRIVGGRPAGCPYRFCGCAVSLKVFGEIRRDLNLAYNWVRKFPRAHAAPGMVAARSGHVFYIQSVNADGTVVAWDPNSGGHRTRIHTVSLRGFTVVDPHGNNFALRLDKRNHL